MRLTPHGTPRMTLPAKTVPAAPTVACPTCGNPARFAPDNCWRPFCSDRCKRIDLGAWAAEEFRVASQEPEVDGDPDAQGA